MLRESVPCYVPNPPQYATRDNPHAIQKVQQACTGTGGSRGKTKKAELSDRQQNHSSTCVAAVVHVLHFVVPPHWSLARSEPGLASSSTNAASDCIQLRKQQYSLLMQGRHYNVLNKKIISSRHLTIKNMH